MIKFLERETTEAIRLHFDDSLEFLSVEDIRIKQIKKGKLNIGFHYILRNGGQLEEGMNPFYYADYELKDYKTSIYVLVTSKKLTDAQKKTLEKLKSKLKVPLLLK